MDTDINYDSLRELGFIDSGDESDMLTYVCQQKDYKHTTKTVSIIYAEPNVYVEIIVEHFTKQGEFTLREHQTVHLNVLTIIEVLMAIKMFTKTS